MILTDLQFLYKAAGPFVSVYLDTTGNLADVPPPVRLDGWAGHHLTNRGRRLPVREPLAVAEQVRLGGDAQHPALTVGDR
jgi:hypothetical protein